MVAIGANDKRNGRASCRAEQSSFCRALGNNIMSSDHYGEISDSSNGTLELRKFDSSIPQTTLTAAFFGKVLAYAALRGKRASAPVENFDYTNEMNKAILNGLAGINTIQYIDSFFSYYEEEIAHLMATENIPQSVWEVIGLAYRYELNAQDLAIESNIYGNPKEEFEYFRAMSTNAGRFFGIVQKNAYTDYECVYETEIIPAVIVEAASVTIANQGGAAGRYSSPELYEALHGRFTPFNRTRAFGHAIAQEEMSNVEVFRYAREHGVRIIDSSLEAEINLARAIVQTTNISRRQEIISSWGRDHSRAWTQNLINEFVVREDQEISAHQSSVLNIRRLQQLTPVQQDEVAQMTGMSVETMLGHPARFYIDIQNDETILAVAEAHVRCDCDRGRVRMFGELSQTLHEEVEIIMTQNGREMYVERVN